MDFIFFLAHPALHRTSVPPCPTAKLSACCNHPDLMAGERKLHKGGKPVNAGKKPAAEPKTPSPTKGKWRSSIVAQAQLDWLSKADYVSSVERAVRLQGRRRLARHGPSTSRCRQAVGMFCPPPCLRPWISTQLLNVSIVQPAVSHR